MSSTSEKIGPWRVVWSATSPRAGLTAALKALDRGEDPAGSVVVKLSKARSVLRVALDDGTHAYLKRYSEVSARPADVPDPLCVL